MLRTLALAVMSMTVLAGGVLAAEKPAKKQAPGLADQMVKQLEKASLTEEQVTKVKEICANHAPALEDLMKQAKLTKEQAAARKEAMEAAKAAGKKGKEANEAADAAANLTEEQKEAMKAIADVRKKCTEECMAVLTAEQKEAMKAKKPKN